MLRDQRQHRVRDVSANACFTSIKHKYLDRHSHVASLHRLGNPGCGGGRVAAVFGQNEMPTNHQTDSCAEKVIKTPRKINIFRLDLATKDAASEKHFADVSFYLNKTHISDIDYEIARRAHGPLRAHSCRARVPDCVIFILPKNHPPESKKKHRKYAGKKDQTFGCQNHMEQNVLTKRNRLGSKPKLFRNRAVQLPRPDASRPNGTSANKGR